MSRRTGHIIFPHSNAKMNSLKQSVVGSGIGGVLLDGGQGGQSSYSGIDDYIETTNKKNTMNVRGEGLADKITSKLKNLNIKPPTGNPKLKNISLSI